MVTLLGKLLAPQSGDGVFIFGDQLITFWQCQDLGSACYRRSLAQFAPKAMDILSYALYVFYEKHEIKIISKFVYDCSCDVHVCLCVSLSLLARIKNVLRAVAKKLQKRSIGHTC